MNQAAQQVEQPKKAEPTRMCQRDQMLMGLWMMGAGALISLLGYAMLAASDSGGAIFAIFVLVIGGSSLWFGTVIWGTSMARD